VSVTNIGDGNLATGGPDPSSNLNGSAGGVVGPAQWSGSGGSLGGGTGLPDTSFSPASATSQAFSYTYSSTGTARGTSLSAAVTVGLTNGSSDNTNSAQTVNVTLVGNTVGPVYQSEHAAAINTPGKNGTSPASTIDWGTVSTVGKHTELLMVSNFTTDADGGSPTLTDLDIENFTITGDSNFTIHGKQSGVGTAGLGTPDIIVKGDSEFIAIDFNALGAPGSYSGELTLFTDEDTGYLGAGGNFYVYQLTAFAMLPAPEPQSLLLLSVGIGGVLLVRRRRSRSNGSGTGAS